MRISPVLTLDFVIYVFSTFFESSYTKTSLKKNEIFTYSQILQRMI